MEFGREQGHARLLIQINGEGGGEYPAPCINTEWEDVMPESVYDVILLIGNSKESWKRPPPTLSNKLPNLSAIFASQKSSKLDMQLDAKGKVEAYRAKVRLSFKVER